MEELAKVCYTVVKPTRIFASLCSYSVKINQMCGRQNNLFRYLSGYLLGIAIFLILIPYALWSVASIDNQVFQTRIVPADNANIYLAIPIFVVGVIFVVW